MDPPKRVETRPSTSTMTRTIPQPAIEPTAAAELTDTERYRLLSSERRRRILAVLSNRTRPIRCEELAATLARSAAGMSDSDPADVRDLRISLHHVHLPAMDDYGVIDYDPATRTVTLVE